LQSINIGGVIQASREKAAPTRRCPRTGTPRLLAAIDNRQLAPAVGIHLLSHECSGTSVRVTGSRVRDRDVRFATISSIARQRTMITAALARKSRHHLLPMLTLPR